MGLQWRDFNWEDLTVLIRRGVVNGRSGDTKTEASQKPGKIGWHTFRHSYSTILRGAGTDIKVQQELLRHATIQSTMNIYTQAVSEQKRIANSVVVGVLFNEMAPAA